MIGIEPQFSDNRAMRSLNLAVGYPENIHERWALGWPLAYDF